MSTSDDACLFGAPHHFFLPHVKEGYAELMTTRFHEVWHREDLTPSEHLRAWVTHPGHDFVIDEDVLALFPNLEVLVTASTGNNHVDMAACERAGVAFYSLLDDRPALEDIAASAEGTFLLLLNALRKLPLAVREVEAGRWRQNEDVMRGRELQGRRVGVVGLGRIGRRMHRYCTAFGAEVSYYDPYVEDDRAPRVETLEELFSTSEIVVIACSLTHETRGLIGAELIDLLEPGSVLINSARGEILDEHALAARLRERADLLVGLDVVSGEVTGTQYQSPLIELMNPSSLVIVPHIVGVTVDSQSKAASIALDLLRRHFA